MTPSPLVCRIAPTPSGYLHAGNALNFILCWVLCRREQGRLMLRIDDLDAARAKREYIEDIFMVIDRLGIDYDFGPFSVQDMEREWSQRHREERYQSLLMQLRAKGFLFSCNCSRLALKQTVCKCAISNPDFDLADQAWKIKTSELKSVCFDDLYLKQITADPHLLMPEPVARRRDGLPAFLISSLADDLDFGVNLLVRGEDLLPATVVQLGLAKELMAESFSRARFFHHPLLSNADGKKLSKSSSARALQQIPAGSAEIPALFEQVARWLGLPPARSAAELLALAGAASHSQQGSRIGD